MISVFADYVAIAVKQALQNAEGIEEYSIEYDGMAWLKRRNVVKGDEPTQ